MRVSCDFFCDLCQWTTPGGGDLPDDTDPSKVVKIHQSCDLCGAPLTMAFLAGEVLAPDRR
jgi:hypothetical protein